MTYYHGLSISYRYERCFALDRVKHVTYRSATSKHGRYNENNQKTVFVNSRIDSIVGIIVCGGCLS
jgi:hypothetical protein